MFCNKKILYLLDIKKLFLVLFMFIFTAKDIMAGKNKVEPDLTCQEDCRSLVLYKPRQPLSEAIKKFYEEMERKSFNFQIIEKMLFSPYKEPSPRTLIILSGVNSSGKSYLAQRLVTHDPTAVFISMRTVCIEMAHDFLSRRKAAEFQKIYSIVGDSFFGLLGTNRENPMMKRILKSVKNKEEFLGALDELEKIYDRDIFRCINKVMLERAMPFLCLGRSVVLDRVSYEHDYSIFEELTPFRVLVYCSLPHLTKRLQVRNLKAFMDKDANEYRFCLSLYKNFAEFFRPKKGGDRDLGLGSLKKDDLLEKIEAAYTLSKPDLPPDFIPFFPSFKENLLRSMNFHRVRKIKLYPRDEVDFVLDTSNLSPQESFLYLLHSIKLIRAFSPKVKLTHPLTVRDFPRGISFDNHKDKL